MNAREAFYKAADSEGATLLIAKRVSSGEMISPISKSEWIQLIEYQARANFPELSKASAFSKYLDTETGKELFWASKMSPGAEIEAEPPAPPADVHKALASSRGSAHMLMYVLATDSQWARGGSYEAAYTRVYSHPDNQTLRERVKREHLRAVMQDRPGEDDDGREVAGPNTMTIDEAGRLDPVRGSR